MNPMDIVNQRIRDNNEPITKRDILAGFALGGLLAQESNLSNDECPAKAVELADELLKELKKRK